jgi:hypothetical protein
LVDDAIVARRPHIDRVANEELDHAQRQEQEAAEQEANENFVRRRPDQDSKSGHVELEEKELQRVSGGRASRGETSDVFKTVK